MDSLHLRNRLTGSSTPIWDVRFIQFRLFHLQVRTDEGWAMVNRLLYAVNFIDKYTKMPEEE
jgi:hypothetical protein